MIPIVREMIARIDTLTAAGQRYTMAKIATEFATMMDDRISHAPVAGGPRNRAAAAELLEGLTHESERLWPDAQAFANRAERLLRLLDA
jgi:hypothetical protein